MTVASPKLKLENMSLLVQPGSRQYHDLASKLDVPSRDQRLFHFGSLLAATITEKVRPLRVEEFLELRSHPEELKKILGSHFTEISFPFLMGPVLCFEEPDKPLGSTIISSNIVTNITYEVQVPLCYRGKKNAPLEISLDPEICLGIRQSGSPPIVHIDLGSMSNDKIQLVEDLSQLYLNAHNFKIPDKASIGVLSLYAFEENCPIKIEANHFGFNTSPPFAGHVLAEGLSK